MQALANIWKIAELRKRILFSLMMLAVYRIGVFVTIPGVNRTAMREALSTGGGFLNLFNLFSGGALENMSIFALGIMPYVTASIVLQLLTVLYKPLEELRKEGETGQRKINQYTRYFTVVLATVQGTMLLANQIVRLNGNGVDVVREPTIGFYIVGVTGLAAGTAFLMWMGEQITERGIGNGISLVIFAGIVADLPDAVTQTGRMLSSGDIQPVTLLVIGLIVLAVIAVIVFFERGQRRIALHSARRTVTKQVSASSASTYLPLRVNSGGVVPPIFASSLLMLPGQLQGTIPGIEKVQDVLVPGSFVFTLLYVSLIIFFSFFYTGLTVNPDETADNLKKQNTFVANVRPGEDTARYIDTVLTRITWAGALYMALVCVVPQFLADKFRVPFFFGGTSVMIVVGVALDTVQQVETYLINHHYEGLAGPGGPRIRGRAG